MQLELIMYAIRRVVEDKTGAQCFATYPPKDNTCFGSQAGADYHRFIMFTQVFEVQSNTGLTVKFYLYYRNKRTRNYPEFSSCEFGMFTGNVFVSLFKEHIDQKSEDAFAQLVTDKIIETIKNI